jgi:hypothetical protein
VRLVSNRIDGRAICPDLRTVPAKRRELVWGGLQRTSSREWSLRPRLTHSRSCSRPNNPAG